MIVWEHDQSSGLWLEKIRVGEVGGNTLGNFLKQLYRRSAFQWNIVLSTIWIFFKSVFVN